MNKNKYLIKKKKNIYMILTKIGQKFFRKLKEFLQLFPLGKLFQKKQ
jgi:hypothetical protein